MNTSRDRRCFHCFFLAVSILLAAASTVSAEVPDALKPPEKLPKTGVTFKTDDVFLQNLYDKAETTEASLEHDFIPGWRALYEGAEYKYFWLETQPMTGVMYAKRDVEIARNLQMIFFVAQREDGRIPAAVSSAEVTRQRGWIEHPSQMSPGQVLLPEMGVTAFFGQLQGYTLPQSALDVYYMAGANDPNFLRRLYETLEKYDAYLWRVRDSNKDGILEIWCGFDNGEDNGIRNFDAPDRWHFDYPPLPENLPEFTQDNLRKYWPLLDRNRRQHRMETGLPRLERIRMPYQSMDVMAWSYAGRNTLSEISALLDNGKADFWREKAESVRKTLIEKLWRPEKHACYDRDKNGNFLEILLHNNLRCMYYGIFTPSMADEFVRYHLLNPEEFWTPLPLVSTAANDPLFRNEPGNSWSGKPQGLTYQRAIRALENYGHDAEVSLLGRIYLDNLGKTCRFRQQFDPFTGEPDDSIPSAPEYGPTMMAALEYFSRLYGIHIARDGVFWSGMNRGEHAYETTQRWGDRLYELKLRDGRFTATLNGKECFRCTADVRVVTDFDGRPKRLVGIAPKTVQAVLEIDGRTWSREIEPNTVWSVEAAGKTTLQRRTPFDFPYRKPIE